MNKETKDLATYKEFGKMLREVANLYAKMGDRPLAEEGKEYEYISERIRYITPKHTFEECIIPLREKWRTQNFDVNSSKKWGEYVIECREKGLEPDYDNYKEK